MIDFAKKIETAKLGDVLEWKTTERTGLGSGRHYMLKNYNLIV